MARKKGKGKVVAKIGKENGYKQAEAILQGIYDANGILTSKLVVDEARDPKNPLHDRFEWDDGIAGEAFRMDQARTLIRSFRVVVRTEVARVQCHAYVRAPQAERKEQGYKHIKDIQLDEDDRLQIIESEILRAVSILSRVREISLTLGMDLGIERYIDELGRLSVEVTERRKAA